jgi:hypothetical protein
MCFLLECVYRIISKAYLRNIISHFAARSAWANVLGKELASIAEVAFSKSYATR